MLGVWKFLANVVAPEPYMVSKETGCFEYPAVQITSRGVKLSYTAGFYSSAERLPALGDGVYHVLETEELDEHSKDRRRPNRFKITPHLRCGSVQRFVGVFNAAEALEVDIKKFLARQRVENYKEIGRKAAG